MWLVQAFTFEADFRIGNGTQNPADGFSVNYARAGDPVLVSADAGNPTGYATGPNCEANDSNPDSNPSASRAANSRAAFAHTGRSGG